MSWMGYDTVTKEVFEFWSEDEDALWYCVENYKDTIYFEAEVEYLVSTPEGDMNWVEEIFHSILLLRQFGEEPLVPATWREMETKMEAYLRRADDADSFFTGSGKMEQAFPYELRKPKKRTVWTEPAVTVEVDAP